MTEGAGWQQGAASRQLTLFQWCGGKDRSQFINGTEEQAHSAICQQHQHNLALLVPRQQGALVAAAALWSCWLLVKQRGIVAGCGIVVLGCLISAVLLLVLLGWLL